VKTDGRSTTRQNPVFGASGNEKSSTYVVGTIKDL
jgi:hypothetical protein